MLVCLLFAALPTVDELRQMPEVASVEVRAVENASHRIIHVLNWHYVSRDDFALDGDPDAYEAFLGDVEAVQIEQMAFLQRLNVKKVFYEGLTTKNHADYVERAATIQKLDLPNGKNGVDLLLAEFMREDTLQLGSPGRLLMAGKLNEVAPGDDDGLLEKANPIKDGRVVHDEGANKDREDAVVRLLKKDKESVLVMGGGHDLSDNCPAGVEYVRVALKMYRAVTKGK